MAILRAKRAKRAKRIVLAGLAFGFSACAPLVASVDRVSSDSMTVVTLTVPFNNSHLLIQNGRGILIDSGGEEDAEQLDQMITKAGFDPAKLAAVVVTHGHHDHAGGALHFREAYGTPIIAGAGDVKLIKAGRNDKLCPTGSFGALRRSNDQNGSYTGYTPDIILDKPFNLARRFGIDAVITPLAGHTHGSLIVSAGRYAFVGDLFRGTLSPGGAATHFYLCDLEDNRRDISTLLTTLAPDAQQFFTGHFPSATRSPVEKLIEKRGAE